ncbi:response regulator [Thalassotalea euphylliae]|uniref:response regulator n=1 Tax=Thalassotalea euphylliae TaxID=1655234 RepID=UPI003628785A
MSIQASATIKKVPAWLSFFAMFWLFILALTPMFTALAADSSFPEFSSQTKAASPLKADDLQQMATELKYLDEVLTSSVLSFAFSGDEKWLVRYNEHEPLLSQLLATLMKQASPQDKERISLINTANNQLVTIESDAIAKVKSGQKQAALALINDEQYRQFKQAYMDACLAYIDVIQQREAKASLDRKLDYNGDALVLTDEEQQWVKNNIVNVGVEHFPPFLFLKPDGGIGGLSGAILAEISTLTGLQYEVTFGPWSQLLAQFEEGSVDLLPDVYYQEDRLQYGSFSVPYYVIQEMIFVLGENVHLNEPDDLATGTIAVPKAYSSIDLLKGMYPDISIIETENTDESINAVLEGRADALVDAQLVVEDRLRSSNINTLRVIENKILPSSSIHIFTTNREPILQSIIQKALEKIEIKKVIDRDRELLDASGVSDINITPIATDTQTYYWAAGAVIILLIVSASISALVLRNDEQALVAKFSSPRFKRSVIGSLLLIALIMFVIAALVLKKAEQTINDNLSYNLNTLLNSTHNRLNSWIQNEFVDLNVLSQNTELVNLVEQLLVIPPSKEALLTTPAQAQIRQFFAARANEFGSEGFFIISPEMISLASKRDENVGTINFIHQEKPELLASVLSGKSAFIPPIRSDVQLTDQSNNSKKLPPTMFIAAPIFNAGGKVIAVITRRIDPSDEFSAIFSAGFIGKSGETYAFSNEGLLLSKVRFENQLKSVGLVAEDETALLNIRIANPGKNILSESFTPEEVASWPLTEMAQSATGGFSNANFEGYNDYRGLSVVGTWLWDDALQLGIAAEMDHKESFELLQIFKYTIIGMLAFSLVVIFGGTLFTLSMGTKATRSLSRSHNELESIVASRTAELQHTMKRISTIIDNASDGIVVINASGTVEEFSPSAENMFGYQRDEILGKDITLIMEKPFHHAASQELSTGTQFVIEQKGKRKDGSEFDIGIAVGDARLDNLHIFTGMVRDITLKKEQELALEKAKTSAEEATQAKSDFLANMSHEIRTPMNAIIGMSYLALQTRLDEKQIDYVNKIHSSANSLLGIINDILDFSKIEAGKLTLEQAPFNLQETLEHLVQIISFKSQQKGLELLIDLANDVPLGLKGDSLRLAQILINLANNAIKFTDEGSIIIKIRANTQSDTHAQLQFSVTDTGIGMNEEQLGRLFQSFSQADASTTRKYGGTGLGLTISKSLAEMMGGEIWVESEPNKGSTFSFTANFTIAKDAVITESSAPDLKHLRILIVDDSEAAREILVNIANSLEISTTCVSNAKAAITELEESSARNKTIDVMLCDWQMPGIDGLDLAGMIRTSNNLSIQPKIIMITAYDKDEMVDAAQGIDINGFLTKPLNASSLVDALMNALGTARKSKSLKTLGKINVSPTEKIQGAHVLLVEDNEINQQIAVELLQMAKLHVDVADNGQIAVDKLKTKSYDAVLMDIQMPVMDGYQATQAIRNELDMQDLPILAMTANAMAGDREKCLAAGMNDHLTKPIDPNEVYERLAHWIKPDVNRVVFNAQSQPSQEVKQPIPDIEGLDTKNALLRMGGNTELFIKLLDKFTKTQANAVDEIKHAIDKNQCKDAERIAHTLKGVAANIGATKLAAAAKEVEHALSLENTDIAALLKQTSTELAQTITNINAASVENTAAETSCHQASAEEIATQLQQLFEEIEDFDANAQETWRTLSSGLGSSVDDSLKAKIKDALDNYDFDQAEQLLQNISANIS